MEQQHELTPEEFKKMMQAKEQAAFSLLTAQTTRIMTNEDEFLDFLNKLADHVSFDLSGLPKRYPEQTSFRSMLETCQEIAHDLAYRLNNKLREQNTRNCAGDNRHLHFAKEG